MVWEFITLLGDEKIYLFLIPLVYFLIERRLAWRLLLLSILSASCVYVLKDVLKLPRPPPSTWKVEANGYGFPSGHTTVSASFWSYLSLKMKNKALYVFSALLVSLIALSRIILHVHYIRDVVGGIVIGLCISLAVLRLEREVGKISERKKERMTLAGAVIFLILIPYLSARIPFEGAVLLGFAIGHIVCTYFIRIPERRKMKNKLISFAISMMFICLSFVFCEEWGVIVILGLLSSLVPQTLWHFIDKRVEKQG